jgi:hypothetical protein
MKEGRSVKCWCFVVNCWMLLTEYCLGKLCLKGRTDGVCLGTKVKYLVFEPHQRCPFGGVTLVHPLMGEEDLMEDSAESAE